MSETGQSDAAGPTLDILLVEDNPQSLKLCRDLLAVRGHRVLLATDGGEAILQARLHRPDLIVMDIQLPIMNGLAATGELRRLPETRHIPIIALTAFAMKGDAERFLQAGFNCYIPKPIDTRRFAQQVLDAYRQGSATPPEAASEEPPAHE